MVVDFIKAILLVGDVVVVAISVYIGIETVKDLWRILFNTLGA